MEKETQMILHWYGHGAVKLTPNVCLFLRPFDAANVPSAQINRHDEIYSQISAFGTSPSVVWSVEWSSVRYYNDIRRGYCVRSHAWITYFNSAKCFQNILCPSNGICFLQNFFIGNFAPTVVRFGWISLQPTVDFMSLAIYYEKSIWSILLCAHTHLFHFIYFTSFDFL